MTRPRSILSQVAPAFVASLLFALPVFAQSSIRSIEPRIERRALSAVLARVAMDDDQRLITDILYADYTAALERLAERTVEKTEDAGRQRVDDALSGRVFLDPDELRRLRVAVGRTKLQSWEEADQLAQGLLTDLRLGLDEETGYAFDLALRDLRRSMYLKPRRDRDQDDAYAADGLDVIALFEEAAADGGEFENIDRSRFDDVLEHYADSVDQHLLETAAVARRGQAAMAIARIERNEPARRSEEHAAVARWRVLYQVTREAVESVAAISREARGPSAEASWRVRVDSASFPRVFRPTASERAREWINARVEEPDVLAKVQKICDDFTLRNRALRREAVDLMLRARLERGAIVHPRMDPASIADPVVRELYRSLLKNSGQRTALASESMRELEGLVTDRQRKQMRADVAASAYGRRRR